MYILNINKNCCGGIVRPARQRRLAYALQPGAAVIAILWVRAEAEGEC